MDQRADAMSALDDRSEGLHGAHLIVRKTDRNDPGSRRDRVQVHSRGAVYPGDDDWTTRRLQAPGRAQNRLMLRGPRHKRSPGSEKGEVDGLGAGRNERDLCPAGA